MSFVNVYSAESLPRFKEDGKESMTSEGWVHYKAWTSFSTASLPHAMRAVEESRE